MVEFIGGGVSFGVYCKIVPFTLCGFFVADFLSVVSSRKIV